MLYTWLPVTCYVQYVGRTTRRLRDRFYEHIHSVAKKGTNIAKHLRECHKCNIVAMKVQVIEKVCVPKRRGGLSSGCCAEGSFFWIHQPQTHIPSGLNLKWDVSHYHD